MNRSVTYKLIINVIFSFENNKREINKLLKQIKKMKRVMFSIKKVIFSFKEHNIFN